MKHITIIALPLALPLAALLAALSLGGCGGSLVDSRFVLNFPAPPPAWTELLGPPRWRVEWISPAGTRESMETGAPGEGVEIDIPPTEASPVLAWPFWPKGQSPGITEDIPPGIFRPAGAIFPFDAAGGRIDLSWQGGVDAFFYYALLHAAGAAQAAAQTAGPASTPEEVAAQEKAAKAARMRVPQNFDWPRFREIFEDPAVSEKIHADPWSADLRDIAAKVVKSGFDKRRFKSVPREELRPAVSSGPWLGTSPFAAPLLFEDDVPVFQVRPGTESDTWYSVEGVLRCAGKTWVFRPWE